MKCLTEVLGPGPAGCKSDTSVKARAIQSLLPLSPSPNSSSGSGEQIHPQKRPQRGSQGLGIWLPGLLLPRVSRGQEDGEGPGSSPRQSQRQAGFSPLLRKRGGHIAQALTSVTMEEISYLGLMMQKQQQKQNMNRCT